MSPQSRLSIIAFCVIAFPLLIQAQSPAKNPKATASTGKRTTTAPPTNTTASATADPMLETRRITAISLMTSLADEARNFNDPTLRARVQARAADALWETDKERARNLFRRAFEAAETADQENRRREEEEIRAQQAKYGSAAIARRPNLCQEVLKLASRRERALGEELLSKIEEARKKEEADLTAKQIQEQAEANSRNKRRSPFGDSSAQKQRLTLAIQLLNEGNTDLAIQIADPALTTASIEALKFLNDLRSKNPEAANQRYLSLLSRAANDPSSDANSVSFLSSYLFTPYLYIGFSHDSGTYTSQTGRATAASPDELSSSPQIRLAFFQTAALILLRPLPPPDQDRTSSGRAGTYMVIARLLPLFEQYAPDKAPALRAQLTTLAPDTPEHARNLENRELKRGFIPEEEETKRDRVQEHLDRLDRAKTSTERDSIYTSAALAAVSQNDSRAREFIDKIEDADLRSQVSAYANFQLVQQALQKKDFEAVVNLARSGEMTPLHSAWAFTEAARLTVKDAPGRAAEMLEEALVPVRRIDESSSDRVRALVAIATQFFEVDRSRVWELMSEIVKAANSVSDFTGEDAQMVFAIRSKGGTHSYSTSANSFDLREIFGRLTKEDFNRTVEIAKSFTAESPRAVATLAVAQTALEKKK